MNNEIWSEIGSLSDIPQRGARRVRYGSTKIAVFRTFQDNVFALEDICTNCDGPISEGIVSDASVSCPVCGWEISLETGEALGADVGQVRTFAVRLIDDKILLCPSSASLAA